MTIELASDPPPEWMVALENKKLNHKLAHEIGAGAPCFKCKNGCLGLDLHFWRKICRNCKCKKELHDVKEENSFEQFQILFGENFKGSERVKEISLNLKNKLDRIFANHDQIAKDNSLKTDDYLSFDWIPADIPANLASEYLQLLPLEKLPITGSAGALLRRQQLEKQIPLHDFKVNNCHDLTDEETVAFTEYVDNLKNNAVGKGLVTKILPSPVDNDYAKTPVKMPAFSNNLNSMPKPFKSFADGGDLSSTSYSPSAVEVHFPSADLKTPSAFVPYRKLNVKLTPSQNESNGGHDESVARTIQPFVYDKLYPTLSSVDHLTAQYADTFTVNDKNSMNLDTVNNNDQNNYNSNINNSDRGNNNNNNNNNNNDNYDDNNIYIGDDSNIPNILNNNNNGGDVSSPTETLTPSQIIRKFNKAQPSRSAAQSPAPDRSARHEPVRAPNTFCERSRSYGASGGSYSAPLTSDVRAEVPVAGGVACAAKNVDAKYSKLGQPEQFVALSSYVPNRPQLSNALTGSPMSNAAAGERDGNQNPRTQFGPITTVGGSGGDGATDLCHPVAVVAAHAHGANAVAHPNPYRVCGGDGTADIYCHQCKLAVNPGQIVVVAERAGHEGVWHPQCFVCVICEELLVDLVYFFNRGEVYCGRHYAEVLKIPRCFACDELIFVKEYTVAEGQTFHIKHFCCYECDVPLAEKSYVSKDDNPVCLPCYELKYSKRCNCCGETIKAGDSRVGWKEFSWHATATCFKCVQCLKSLLGGKFVVRRDNPLCIKECVIQFDLNSS